MIAGTKYSDEASHLYLKTRSQYMLTPATGTAFRKSIGLTTWYMSLEMFLSGEAFPAIRTENHVRSISMFVCCWLQFMACSKHCF